MFFFDYCCYSSICRVSEIITDYRVSKYFAALGKLFTDSMLSRALGNLPWLESVHQMTVNNPDFWSIEQAAALGIGNARALGKIFALVRESGLRCLLGKRRVTRECLHLFSLSHHSSILWPTYDTLN